MSRRQCHGENFSRRFVWLCLANQTTTSASRLDYTSVTGGSCLTKLTNARSRRLEGVLEGLDTRCCRHKPLVWVLGAGDPGPITRGMRSTTRKNYLLSLYSFFNVYILIHQRREHFTMPRRRSAPTPINDTATIVHENHHVRPVPNDSDASPYHTRTCRLKEPVTHPRTQPPCPTPTTSRQR